MDLMPGAASAHPAPTSALLNRFTLQVALSTVAVVLVQGNLPHLLAMAGMPVALLGVVFFLSRLGAILGAQSGPWVLRRISPHWASVFGEALNLLCCLALYRSVVHPDAVVFTLAVAIRGLSIGFIPNVRVSWLKSLPDQEIARRVLVITRVIVQSSYGLIGLLLLLGIAQKWALALVLVDAATSAVAIPIFFSMRDLGIEVFPKVLGMTKAFGALFRGRRAALIVGDFCLATALGGTNIFLVRAGAGLFQAVGGYGLALVIYAGAFLLGGLVVQAKDGTLLKVLKVSEPASPWVLLLCLAILRWGGLSSAWHAAAFFAMFVAYPVFLLTLETAWFRSTSREDVGPIFANRQMLISLVLAVGEVLYPHWTMGSELAIRFCMALAAALTYILFIRGSADLRPSPA